MRNEYRIVKDGYSGFEVQVRRWWFPVWLQCGINTHRTLEQAEAYARAHAKGSIKYLGYLRYYVAVSEKGARLARSARD